MVWRWHVYRWVWKTLENCCRFLKSSTRSSPHPISKRPSKFSCKHRSCGHPSTLPFPPLLLEIYQALDDWSDLELNGETGILHWRNTGCKKWLCTKFARGNYVKEQRTTILTLCPVSPGFPGAPGTPGKPLELTKSKSQVLLAIIIIQYSHTKSAR